MMVAKSYLEFGLIDEGDKKVYDTRFDQEAYDFFMVARYMKDIMSYRANKPENVHHKEDFEDNLKKYAALIACDKEYPVYYEVGSSLMGVIDALEFIDERHKDLDVKSVEFAGADNSEMMNFGARQLHENYKLKLFETAKPFPCDLFFAKGVSLLYALDNVEQLSNILKNSRIGIFDYTFSLNGSKKRTVGTGKSVTYLSLGQLESLVKGSGNLIIEPSERKYDLEEGLETYECVYGPSGLARNYYKLLNRYEKKVSVPK
jgi:hypothetical protein